MADVEVTAISDTPGKAAVAPATVTFTPGEWNQAKTITVTGVEAGGTTITHGASSTDAKYGGGSLRIGSVAVAVTAAPWRAVTPAWHARFGRTVTGQVLVAVEERLAAPREAGVRATLAGHALGTPKTVAASDNAWTAAPDGESGIGAWQLVSLPEQARTVAARELLDGSSFGADRRSVLRRPRRGCGAAGRMGASTGARATWCSTAR